VAWTWLAILAAVAAELLASAAGEPPLSETDDASTDAGEPGWTTAGPRATILATLLAIALLIPTVFAARDRYAALDHSGQHDAQTWVDRALRTMEQDAVILSWWSYSTPLWYAQRVMGERPDITIIDDRTRLDENLGGLTDAIDANLGSRPVYVLRLDSSEVKLLAERYDLEYIDGRDASGLTRVVAKKAT
jgi:hypothetical protein